MGKKNNARKLQLVIKKYERKTEKVSKSAVTVQAGITRKNVERIVEEELELAVKRKKICNMTRKQLEHFPLLSRAVFLGCDKAVDELLRIGENVNAQTTDGSTPLIIAVEREHYRIIHKLLKKGADITACRKDGRNALMTAVSKNDDRAFSILRGYLEKTGNLDINHADQNGFTLLTIAAERGYLEYTKIFLSLPGQQVDKQTNDGWTALMLAVMRGQQEIVRELIAAGSDILLEDKRGATALCMSIANKQPEITDLLLRRLHKKSRDSYVKNRINLLSRPRLDDEQQTLLFYKDILFHVILEIETCMESGSALLRKYKLFYFLIKCAEKFEYDYELLIRMFYLIAMILAKPENSFCSDEDMVNHYVGAKGLDFCLKIMSKHRSKKASDVRGAALLPIQASIDCESVQKWVEENYVHVMQLLKEFDPARSLRYLMAEIYHADILNQRFENILRKIGQDMDAHLSVIRPTSKKSGLSFPEAKPFVQNKNSYKKCHIKSAQRSMLNKGPQKPNIRLCQKFITFQETESTQNNSPTGYADALKRNLNVKENAAQICINEWNGMEDLTCQQKDMDTSMLNSSQSPGQLKECINPENETHCEETGEQNLQEENNTCVENGPKSKPSETDCYSSKSNEAKINTSSSIWLKAALLISPLSFLTLLVNTYHFSVSKGLQFLSLQVRDNEGKAKFSIRNTKSHSFSDDGSSVKSRPSEMAKNSLAAAENNLHYETEDSGFFSPSTINKRPSTDLGIKKCFNWLKSLPNQMSDFNEVNIYSKSSTRANNEHQKYLKIHYASPCKTCMEGSSMIYYFKPDLSFTGKRSKDGVDYTNYLHAVCKHQSWLELLPKPKDEREKICKLSEILKEKNLKIIFCTKSNSKGNQEEALVCKSFDEESIISESVFDKVFGNEIFCSKALCPVFGCNLTNAENIPYNDEHVSKHGIKNMSEQSNLNEILEDSVDIKTGKNKALLYHGKLKCKASVEVLNVLFRVPKPSTLPTKCKIESPRKLAKLCYQHLQRRQAVACKDEVPFTGKKLSFLKNSSTGSLPDLKFKTFEIEYMANGWVDFLNSIRRSGVDPKDCRSSVHNNYSSKYLLDLIPEIFLRIRKQSRKKSKSVSKSGLFRGTEKFYPCRIIKAKDDPVASLAMNFTKTNSCLYNGDIFSGGYLNNSIKCGEKSKWHFRLHNIRCCIPLSHYLCVACIMYKDQCLSCTPKYLNVLETSAGTVVFSTKTEHTLSEGNYGTYIGLLQKTDTPIVVRQTKMRDEISADITQMSALQHKNLAKFYAVCADYKIRRFHFVTELCEMTLTEYLKQASRRRHTKQASFNAKIMVFHIAEAIRFLHENDVIHGYLKPSNIMVNLDDTVKLTDFYLYSSKPLLWGYRKSNLENRAIGSSLSNFCWRPREVIVAASEAEARENVTKGSDIQLLGMVMHYILSNCRHPFGYSEDQCQENIKNGVMLLGPDPADVESRDLIQLMLAAKAEERPNIEDVSKHPYFWNMETRFEFLLEVGRKIHFYTSKPTKAAEMLKQSCIEAVDWTLYIEPVLMMYINAVGNKVLANGFEDLLQFAVTLEANFPMMPLYLKKIVKHPVHYILLKFPTFFMSVFHVIRYDQLLQKQMELQKFFRSKIVKF